MLASSPASRRSLSRPLFRGQSVVLGWIAAHGCSPPFGAIMHALGMSRLRVIKGVIYPYPPGRGMGAKGATHRSTLRRSREAQPLLPPVRGSLAATASPSRAAASFLRDWAHAERGPSPRPPEPAPARSDGVLPSLAALCPRHPLPGDFFPGSWRLGPSAHPLAPTPVAPGSRGRPADKIRDSSRIGATGAREIGIVCR